MIDAHCHLNTSYNSSSVVPIIEKFTSIGGSKIVDVTTTYVEIERSQKLIAAYPEHIYSTIGLHPESPNGLPSTLSTLLAEMQLIEQNLDSFENIVGLGETGLDYGYEMTYGDTHPKVMEQQLELFIAHLTLAKKKHLPIVIHARGRHLEDYSPYQEILHILSTEKFPNIVYFHSFAGDYDCAKKVIDAGYFLGVNGIVTYSNAKNIAEIVEKVPLSTLLLETDAPFLIPSNLERKELSDTKINEPFAVYYTAKRVASLKKCSIEEVLGTTEITTRKVFERIS